MELQKEHPNNCKGKINGQCKLREDCQSLISITGLMKTTVLILVVLIPLYL